MPNGMSGACRVLRAESSSAWVVLLLAGWFPTTPTLDVVARAAGLRRMRFGAKGEFCRACVNGDPPAPFIRLGHVALPPGEDSARWPIRLMDQWTRLGEELHQEWRWHHDRDAFISEVSRAQAVQMAQDAQKRR